MNKLISKLQKDLNLLQATLEREGDKLFAKIKTAANKKGMPTDVEHLETLIEEQVKKFEPALDKFLSNVNKNAAKYGIQLDGIEDKVRHTAKAASKRFDKSKRSTKSTTKSSTKATPKAASASEDTDAKPATKTKTTKSTAAKAPKKTAAKKARAAK